MAFFDKLNDIAKSIGDIANEAIGSNKLYSRMSEVQTAINDLMNQIGEHYYRKYRLGESVDEEVYYMMEEIDQHHDVLKDLELQLTANKEAEKDALCPVCGRLNDPGNRFCQECGNKLEQAQPKTCPSCGELVTDGLKFCGNCGEKL
ncbi:MAG: double zinc ribbon domain-containing protein [Anaerovoracaceae bacterium]|jgi:predicted nucleic acid-binding Zn ribbon protein